MLADVVDLLWCPHCRGEFDIEDRTLLCDRGHSFDIARQGYVSLQTGNVGKIVGDSADMIAARVSFLGSGHFDRVTDALVDAVGAQEKVLEIGVGSGHYLAAVLQRTAGRGIGIDVSKAAARRAAQAHQAIGSVVADVWRGLPVRTGSIDAITCVFSPRNAAESARVLAAGGRLIVVTPTSRHQQELVGELGLIGIDEDKARRLGDSLSGSFDHVDRTVVEYPMELDHAEVGNLVGMGPSVRHLSEGSRNAAISSLEEPVQVTASVVVATYERRASAAE